MRRQVKMISGFVGLSVILLLPCAPVEATPFRVKINSQEFNTCSAVCDNRAHVTAMTILFATLEEAHTIALTEVCLFDALNIASTLGMASPGFWKATVSSKCPSVNGWGNAFGNASFVVGTNVQTYGAGFPTQNSGDGSETRGYACSRGSTYIGYIVSCSAHMTARGSGDAVDQTNEYVWLTATNPISNQPFRVLAGDYNLTPASLPGVFSSSFAALATSSTFPTPTPNKKIDYVHVRNPNIVSQSPHRYCEADRYLGSDHCYVYGSYT